MKKQDITIKYPIWLKSGLIGAVVGLIVSLFMLSIFPLLIWIFLPFYENWLPIPIVNLIFDFLVSPIGFILGIKDYNLQEITSILSYTILFFIIGVIIALRRKK